jgi:surface antigen Omp85-like protein
MRCVGTCTLFALALAAGPVSTARAQESGATTRQGAIEQAQAEKAKQLHPYVPNKGERIMDKIEQRLTGEQPKIHPWFENAYRGGGFAVGLGYFARVSPYNSIDFRGSYSIKSYKRLEAEFLAPRIFKRRGELSVLAGWREATEVGFYGLGMGTSLDDRANYAFQQPRALATIKLFPTRGILMLGGGLEYARWDLEEAGGSAPPIESVYTPATLPGVGADTKYIHSQGTVGIDWRLPSGGYSRRGGFYGVTFHDFNDSDDTFGFRQVDYEVIQHLPILRETWVISLHGLAEVTSLKDDQVIPFFMLPALGGGSNLRGYSSWRFRDRNSLLLQAEWRIMANRFLDTAVFYDAGKVSSHTSDLDLKHLKSDFGFGVRFHSLLATPLRIEVARSNEGTTIIFSSSAVF